MRNLRTFEVERRISLSDRTTDSIKVLLGNADKAARFLGHADTCANLYLDMRGGSRRVLGHRTRLKKLKAIQKAAALYVAALQQLDASDRAYLCDQGFIFAEPDGSTHNLAVQEKFDEILEDHGKDVLRIERSASLALRDHGSKQKGRPIDLASLMFVHLLANFFEEAGGKVSTAPRSKFIQVLEMILEDANVPVSDVRQKVRAAFKRLDRERMKKVDKNRPKKRH